MVVDEGDNSRTLILKHACEFLNAQPQHLHTQSGDAIEAGQWATTGHSEEQDKVDEDR